jgi:hypothetical protein
VDGGQWSEDTNQQQHIYIYNICCTYKVVAGPSAANCCADDAPMPLPLDRPTKEVSTSESNGPATHSAKPVPQRICDVVV